MTGTSTREQQQSFRIRVAAGVALILVGIALFVVLRDLPGAASLSSDDKLSSVPVPVHYPAPELSLYNINGTRQSLTDYRRKILLVNNWATWCPPCKAEMPTLEAYYEAHAAQGLAILAIEAGEGQKDV